MNKSKKMKLSLLTATLSTAVLLVGCTSAEPEVVNDSYSDSSVTENQKPAINMSQESVKPISLGERMLFENRVEFTVQKVNFTDKVSPSKPGDFHTYYEEDSPENTYLDISGELKNLETEDMDLTFSDPVDIEVIYQDKYKYTGSYQLEYADGSDFEILSYVEPLSVRKFHYLVTVPNEVAKGTDSIVANIKYGDKEFQLKIR